jgi:hypothetical protein
MSVQNLNANIKKLSKAAWQCMVYERAGSRRAEVILSGQSLYVKMI